MSYDQRGNMLNYFAPIGSAALDIDAIDATAAVHGQLMCVEACEVSRLMFVVGVLVAADTTAPAVEFNKRPTLGSATGESLLGTLTIPDTSAVGVVIYKDIDPVKFEPGDVLSLEHTVQAADAGTAAGDGYYAVVCNDLPETIANSSSNMVASA